MDDSDSVAERIVVEFLARLQADRAAGRHEGLSHYLALFPGFEAALTAEWEALTREASPRSDEAERFGPYRLDAELGRGGQGIVYRATDTRLDRVVALKLLHPSFEAHGGGFPTAVRRELEALGRIDHPGICVMYEAGTHEGRPFIAMRLVEGRSLATHIEQERGTRMVQDETLRLSTSELAEPKTEVASDAGSGSRSGVSRRELTRKTRVIEEVARAIHAAHEAGVLHRDLKPGNILLSDDDVPVVLDFGLARSEDSQLPTLTVSGERVGTPAYMAPERLRGDRSLDRRSDVWSLGVTLFEWLLLERPFDGATTDMVVKAILEGRPKDPRRIDRGLPRDLAIILATALDPAPDRRYATAADFADDLQRWRRHEAIRARPVGSFTRLQRWTRRNPAVAALSLVLFVVLSGTTLWSWQRQIDLAAAVEEAETNGRRWHESLSEIGRLSVVTELARLNDEARELWPAVPAREKELQAWIARADAVLAQLDEHRAALERLREDALPDSPDRKEIDFPEAAERLRRDVRWTARLDAVAEAARKAGDEDQASKLETYADGVRKVIESQRKNLASWRRWRFADPVDQWRHDVLETLVRDLESFAQPQGQLANVRQRLAFARGLREQLVTDAEAWERVRAELAEDPRFEGIDVPPQVGLVPLGRDPRSKLQEFLHLGSHRGEPPVRDASGRLQLEEESGIILVLLPPGRFAMGAQADDPTAANHDPKAGRWERPVHELSLAPFFMARSELSQAQWICLTGKNPSKYRPAKAKRPELLPITLRHPVEQISWDEARGALERVGLLLPTEAQWEYAARAGTTTPWWTGHSPSDQEVNLADRCAGLANARWGKTPEAQARNDGYHVHAPVDSFPANPFGLHHVLGNNWEWCRDHFDTYVIPVTEGDGARIVFKGRGRVIRGGCYAAPVHQARVSERFDMDPAVRVPTIGVRASRALDGR